MNTRRIAAIEKISWKTWVPGPGEFPCMACGVTNATIRITVNIEHLVNMKFCICETCLKNDAWGKIVDIGKATADDRQPDNEGFERPEPLSVFND